MSLAEHIRYLPYLKRVFIKRGLPIQLIFFVTCRCNCQCTHCFYWNELNQEKKELTLEEIEKIAKKIPRLFSLSLTGGEPTLRPDLPDIAEAFYRHSSPRNIVIQTNGLTPDVTRRLMEELLRKCPNTAVSVWIPFDGLEQEHDRIRGLRGAFSRAVETVLCLKAMKSRYPNLRYVGVGTTCTALNQRTLSDLIRYIHESLRPDDIGLNLVRGNTRDGVKDIDIRYYKKAAYVLEELEQKGKGGGLWGKVLSARKLTGYKIVERTYEERRAVLPCYGGTLTAVLYETGDVYPCEMLPKRMGNIREYGYDFNRLWFSEIADSVRRYVNAAKCSCTYECVLTPNLLFNPRQYYWLIKTLLKQ